MRLSQYFLPLLKENPKEAAIVSHRLMLRAGMIRMVNSGIYSWLPLGLRVLENISRIIRLELDKAGCLEILMPAIQPAELWLESGRYNDYGKEMLRIKDRHDKDMLFGPTHEEVVTDIFRNNIKSYKDLPKHFYQIQWKFRDEIRPRFGILRGREFLMKDNYSFDVDFESAKKSYNLMYKTYLKIFHRMGLSPIPVAANSGAIGGNLSHEFHIMADTGESEIFYDKRFEELGNFESMEVDEITKLYSAADEKHVPENCPIPASDLRSRRGIEVGHIFYFGTKYSTPMGAVFTDKDGQNIPAEMGSYGIGVSRLVGAAIEASHDEAGIIWPEAIAPFLFSVLNLKKGDELCDKMADELYSKLVEMGVTTLYDDTDNGAGAKFATQDLIGTPWQASIGPRSAKNNSFELKNRKTGEKLELSMEAILDKAAEAQKRVK